MNKIDLARWTIDGERMAPAHRIARRAVAWPFLHLLRIALCLVVAAGWGGAAAHQTWRNTK